MQDIQHIHHADLHAYRIVKGDNHFLLDLEGVFEKLKEKGASKDVSLYVEDLLVQQHQRYHNFMTAEADKRRRLLEHVQKLQVSASLNTLSHSAVHIHKERGRVAQFFWGKLTVVCGKRSSKISTVIDTVVCPCRMRKGSSRQRWWWRAAFR